MMTLSDVKSVITNVKTVLSDLIQEGTITAEQANIIYPIVLESILKSNGVGTS